MIRNLIVLPIAVLFLSACVTINIYFPAAATEKAADKIIDEVWQMQNAEQNKPGQSHGSDVKPAENNSQQEAK